MALRKIVVIAFLLFSSMVTAEKYQTQLNAADWNVVSKPSYCELNQIIPKYGVVSFIHQSGDQLRLSVKEQRFKPEIIRASLSIDTPPWMHQRIETTDYVVSIDEGNSIASKPALSVYGGVAETMLDALSYGLSPTFSYVRTSTANLSADTQISVLAVNFDKHYQKFEFCRKDFLPYGIKQRLEKSLFFTSRSTRLNSAVLTQLKNTARYIKEVKESRVIIVSDTALMGDRDKKWFSSRAKTIIKTLKSYGINKNKVSISKGTHTALASNNVIQLNVFGPDSLSTIYYRKGNTKLTLTEKKRLKLVVQYIQEFMPKGQLLIKSYTDSKGKRTKNLRVSRKRGEEVKDYLVSQGVHQDKVIIKAYGESKPIRSNRFSRGRAQNRRITLDFKA